MLLADDLNQILQILPDFIRKPLEKHPKHESLIEIVLILVAVLKYVLPMKLNIYRTELFGKI